MPSAGRYGDSSSSTVESSLERFPGGTVVLLAVTPVEGSIVFDDTFDRATRSLSSAIHLLLLRVADEKRLPFTVRAPNATTARAVKELDEGWGKRFGSAEELFRDLDIRDAGSGISQ